MDPVKEKDNSSVSLPQLAATDEASTAGEAQLGVKTVEAAEKVYGKYSKWLLFFSLGLASYIYSLDGTTTYFYLPYATSEFDKHSLISTIQVAQAVIVSVGKPVIAKISDISSRGTAYVVVLLFYVLGYIVIASAENVGALAVGILLYAVGNTGLQLLTGIIIADSTTLKWRGFVQAIYAAPYIINAFIGANVATGVITHSTWRWGYGMFAIMVPATLAPLILVLLWAERKAKKLGLVPVKQKTSLKLKVWDFFEQLNVIGLALFGTAVALILLPLTLSQTAKNGWKNPSIIAMLVVGCVVLCLFILWDARFAKYPVCPTRFLKNRAFQAAMWISFFDFVSFYINTAYLYSFIVVVKPWSLINMSYFSQTQTLGLTIFGIAAGFLMRFMKGYKRLLIFGLLLRLLGAGLMIHSRGANASDAEVVWSQLLQGWGGGFAVVTTQVSSQASVVHADVAVVTAIVLLWAEIGGAIGSAIAGAIWTNTMPKNLAKNLPQLSAEERATLFGSLEEAASYPRGDPIREGVILSYDQTMRILTIVAAVIAVLPLIFAFFSPEFYLGDQQNAVDQLDLKGEKVRELREKERADKRERAAELEREKERGVAQQA